MRIRKRLKIGGHIFKVSKHKTLDGIGPNKEDCYLGLVLDSHKEIMLATHTDKRKLPKSKRACFFLHEIVHCAAHDSGINLKEKEVGGLTYALYQILHDNRLRF